MSGEAYGVPVPSGGGVVAAIAEGGPAWRAGIAAGDVVAAVDGRELRDVIDWRWLTADGDFTARVSGSDGSVREVRVKPRRDEALGVEFVSAIFDSLRECDNACEFCFVAQLPPGMRPSLYVRDDDFRLSFLSGNFVTLTNVEDADVQRIVEQRLSPLHVSLHAVDADVRRSVLRAHGEDRALEHMDRLLGSGIEVHVQVVLVPGRNDGEVLERTLAWLAAREGVKSVGVVPVGYTRHQDRYRASYEDSRAAADVLDALAPWRARMRAERGVPWLYAADELYFAANVAVPPACDYGGFPQYENGIGMVRTFMDSWVEECGIERDARTEVPVRVTLVTGELFAPVLRELAALAVRAGVDARVLAVPNTFLGGNVTVAGLLTAEDLARAVRADGPSGAYVLPDAVLNADRLTLDDVAADDLPGLCGADVRVVSSDAPGAVAALRGMSAEQGG